MGAAPPLSDSGFERKNYGGLVKGHLREGG